MSAARTIYRIKLRLEDINPSIWRWLEVPSDITLPKFHRVIQVAMRWEDYHLHQFRVGKRRYEVPDPEDLYKSKSLDERRVKLNKIVRDVGIEFGYHYDFGDNWHHRLLLEAIALPETGIQYPRCIGGARSAPPEDTGGSHAYANYLEALADPDHEEHEEKLGWRGPFESEAIDLGENNRCLRKEFGAKVRPQSESRHQ